MPRLFVGLSQVQQPAWTAAAVPMRAPVVGLLVVGDWECHAACLSSWEDQALARREENIVCLHLL